MSRSATGESLLFPGLIFWKKEKRAANQAAGQRRAWG